MNTVLISIILVPIIEIYLFIKIGSEIGALSTILLIFITAFIGVIYARYEGLNTIRSGFTQIIKNEMPAYEILSGAAIAFGALLLIIFPLTRKLIFGKISNKIKNKNTEKKDFIEGEFEDIDEDNDRKI